MSHEPVLTCVAFLLRDVSESVSSRMLSVDGPDGSVRLVRVAAGGRLHTCRTSGLRLRDRGFLRRDVSISVLVMKLF